MRSTTRCSKEGCASLIAVITQMLVAPPQIGGRPLSDTHT
jgi:hypothetical protein